MSVVYIRDSFVFKNIASYNVSTNIWFRDSSITSNVNICGLYTTLLGNKACGIVRPKFAGFETHKDRFFIGDNIYFLDNTSLDSSVEYHENEKATFILRQNGEVVENQLGGMLNELQGMSKSLGSLKALQEADFSGTGQQIKQMNSFYSKLNEAMADLADSVDETKHYKDQLTALNTNLNSLNGVYGGMLSAMGNIGNKS